MQNFHKTNLTLWGAVLSGVIILSAVVFYLHSSETMQPIPDSQDVAQIIFVAAVLLAIAILFLKRSALSPTKVIENAKRQTNTEFYVMNRIRRNYIIIWGLGELICLLGFFNFIMLADIQNYMIFAVVSIYSLLVNRPREVLLIQALEMLKE
jgi:hypothetical protein